MCSGHETINLGNYLITAVVRDCCRTRRCGPERYLPLGRASRHRPFAPRTGTRARFEGPWTRSDALQTEFGNSPSVLVEPPAHQSEVAGCLMRSGASTTRRLSAPGSTSAN